MNKSPGNLARDLSQLPLDTTDRLRDLLSSFSALRSSNRNLVAQLRGSIYELREHRRRLKQQYILEISAQRNGDDRPSVRRQFGLTRREEQVAHLPSQGRQPGHCPRAQDQRAHCTASYPENPLQARGAFPRRGGSENSRQDPLRHQQFSLDISSLLVTRGAGFVGCLAQLRSAPRGRRLWTQALPLNGMDEFARRTAE